MDVRISPSRLKGQLRAIPSKSAFHRAAFLAAAADGPTILVCDMLSDDMEATLSALESLGSKVLREDGRICIHPAPRDAEDVARIDCAESGTTLRFALPMAAALGRNALFTCSGRLPERPLGHLRRALASGGVSLSEEGLWPLELAGSLAPGRYELPGNVSSQYVSGMLLAAAAGTGADIHVAHPIESRPYVDLTCEILARFGVSLSVEEMPGETVFSVPSGARLRSPGTIEIEGDWSCGATWVAAGALGHDDTSITGLSLETSQADVAIVKILRDMGIEVGTDASGAIAAHGRAHGAAIDISMCPDLAPIVCAVATTAVGTTRICGAARLRLKESDRLEACRATICDLGGSARIEGDDLVVEGCEQLPGGTCDSFGDHRIAMMAALMGTASQGETVIRGAECVSKSYPGFYHDLAELGGCVEEMGA